jgi:uncharacterized repeat protein (TIGR02543 family)
MLKAEIFDDNSDTSDPNNLLNGVNFTDGAADVAVIGYNGPSPKQYTVRFTLTNLPTTTAKTLEITLPIGMAWINSGYSGTVVEMVSGTPSKTATSPASDMGYDFLGGAYTYNILSTTSAVTIDAVISADLAVWTNQISNAITATLTANSNTETATLETVNISNPSGVTPTAQAASTVNSNAIVNQTVILQSIQRGINMANSLDRNVLSAYVVLHVDNSGAVITKAGTSSDWTMLPAVSDGVGGASYTFNYHPAGGSREDIRVPWEISFPDPDLDNPKFNGGDKITVTWTDAQVTFKQYPNTTGTYQKTLTNLDAVQDIFNIVLEEDHVFVGYSNIDSATDKVSHQNLSESPQISALDDEISYLGRFTVGNWGGKASGSKIVRMHFDSDVLGVMGLYLPIPAGQKVTSVTVNGVPKTVNFTGTTYVSYATFGLSRDSYFTDIEYNLTSIPALTMLGITQSTSYINPYYGKWLDASKATGIATIEIVDTAPGTATTGVSTATLTKFNTIGSGQIGGTNGTLVKNAGSSFDFSVTFQGGTGNNNQSHGTTENPILYLRIEAVDETGYPLPVSNLKITNGTNRIDSRDITSECIIDKETVVDVGGGKLVRIVKIDTKNITDGSAFLGYNYIKPDGNRDKAKLFVSFSLATTTKTPGQKFYYNDMFFFNDSLASTIDYYSADEVMYRDEYKTEFGATGRITGLKNGTMGQRFYQIEENASMIVDTKIKRSSDSEFKPWVSGAEPIGIGTTPTTGVQMAVDVFNNSGVTLTNPTEIYMPIPKKGQNWGALIESTTKATLKLTGSIDLPDGVSGSSNYTILYGENVIPSDDGPTLQTYAWKDAGSVINWANVNCIKITASNVPDKETGRFIMDLTVDTNQADMGSGLIDQWHPYYYQNLTNSAGKPFAGWFPGQSMSIETMLAAAKGQLFLDADGDNIYDAGSPGEELLGEWTIDVARADNPATTVQTVTTKPDGSYEIWYLLEDTEYIFKVTNDSWDTDRYTYRFCTKNANAAGNKFVAAEGHVTANAEVSPELPNAFDEIQTIANIGVKANTTTIKLHSQDTAKGSVYGAVENTVTATGNPIDTFTTPATPANTGYTFAGWATSASSSTIVVSPNGQVASGGATFGWDDVEYWAVFNLTPHKITFEPKGGTGIMADQPFTYHENKKLSDNIYEKTGYNFMGWDTNSAGTTVVYANKANYTLNVDDDVTLYAVWALINHNITYNLDGGTNDVNNPDSYNVTNTFPISIAVPTKTGYDFTGWTATGGLILPNTLTAEIPEGTTGPIVFTAHWAIKSHTLTYNLNDNDGDVIRSASLGIGGAANDTLDYGRPINTASHYSNIPGNTKAPTRIGYVFGGWYLEPACTNSANLVTMPDSTLDIFAKWIRTTHTVTFVAGNGGSLTGTMTFADIDHGTTWNAANITVPTPVPNNEHYSFTGWSSDFPTGSTEITSNMTFTANFAIDSHSVSYNGNGYSSGNVPATSTKTHGQTISIASAGSLGRTGYTFLGWSEDPAATAASYAPASSITNIDRDYSLHAVWSKTPSEPPVVTPATYTVNYDGGGDNVTGLPSGATLKEGDKYTVSGNIPERAGYTFNGWIATSGISGNYSGGNNFTMPASNVVLTASWKVVPPVINPPVVEHPTATEPPVVTPVSVNPPATLTSEEEPIAEPEVTPPNASVVPDPVEPEASKPDATFNGAVKDENIPKIGVPLYGPKGFDAWSLLDLILMLVGAVLTVITIIGAIRRGRKDDDELDYRTFEDDGEKKKSTRMLFVIIMSILTVASVLLFVLTQDVTLPMVWLDKWTIVFAVVLIAQIVSRKLSRKTEKDEDVDVATVA